MTAFCSENDQCPTVICSSVVLVLIVVISVCPVHAAAGAEVAMVPVLGGARDPVLCGTGDRSAHLSPLPGTFHSLRDSGCVHL